MDRFLEEHPHVDYSSQNIRAKAEGLFSGVNSPVEKAKIAYEFVHDEIPHSFDINASVITARASDVLAAGTGICHAKANLLAALLRSAEIPAVTECTATMRFFPGTAGSSWTPAAIKRE